MKLTLTDKELAPVFENLTQSNDRFLNRFPGEPTNRQPVHTVYGGAHLFKSETTKKIGKIALNSFRSYAPTPDALKQALNMSCSSQLVEMVYRRVEDKLTKEAVEDFRIDFEDGYGIRPDSEEDQSAVTAANEVAIGMKNETLPPFIGIRIKPFSNEMKQRSIRSLDIFVSTLVDQTGGKLPENFVVTLPKITHPKQVETLVSLFETLENKTSLASGSLKLEMMIETTQAILDAKGHCSLAGLLEASQGRCVAAHFGTYDYTATCDITAEHQSMNHPSCDFARHMMKVSYAGTGIWISDGATNVMPVPPHKVPKTGGVLTDQQLKENMEVVHRAWKLTYDHTKHSLWYGFYQGWDLHPGQIPIRFASCYSFFLEGLEAASVRLKNFINQATKATLVGDIFDDAATGQGLLNYFLRAYNCGAITEKEIFSTGLNLEDLQTRSFMKILESRKNSM